MLARRLQHAAGRGVDHCADPARLGVERILAGHNNPLEDDRHQSIAGQRQVFALENQSYHAAPQRSSARRVLAHSARNKAESTHDCWSSVRRHKSSLMRRESLLDGWSTDLGKRLDARWTARRRISEPGANDWIRGAASNPPCPRCQVNSRSLDAKLPPVVTKASWCRLPGTSTTPSAVRRPTKCHELHPALLVKKD